MSNTQVGNVYQQVIADVVESSRVDFEEVGVDEQVLELMKQGWQQKLSQLQVATFPWDPKPDPPPQISNPPTVPSNAGGYHPMSAPAQQQPMYAPQQVAPPQNNGPRIKSEPGLESPTTGSSQQATYQPPPILPPTATTAQQRAAMNLQQNYGPRAAASINAIQGNMSQQQQAQPSMQQMQQQQAYQQQLHMQQQRAAAGMQGQQRPPMTEDQYRQVMARDAAAAQQRIHAQARPTMHQTDGAGEELEESVSVIKRFNADGEEVMGRIEIDGLIRDKIASMGQSMEGGGLMLPLRQATNSTKRQRKAKNSAFGPSQHDGPGSDEEDIKQGVKNEQLDEDAINSDLDDPEDGLNEEDDDEDGMGHIMLCMYDKVQRVKNKWKCVMKDGVLTVNGKEYVFHKASGEYEW